MRLILLFLSFSLISSIEYNNLYYKFGLNLGNKIPTNILSYFKQIQTLNNIEEYSLNLNSNLNKNSLILLFGNNEFSLEYCNLNNIQYEGYNLTINKYKKRN